ncbi:hypothetical protein ANN_12068 [Periplaneta americana]|uniref:Dipeptidylpeptidase IV N-terminal domain-containing protein n=1 Tax=Periplaneta americana TaxID=6978 RepID=A0ABQ8T8P8_PERAM|nr:hypothetical protein ANN_12068 [Periplaneta americana]
MALCNDNCKTRQCDEDIYQIYRRIPVPGISPDRDVSEVLRESFDFVPCRQLCSVHEANDLNGRRLRYMEGAGVAEIFLGLLPFFSTIPPTSSTSSTFHASSAIAIKKIDEEEYRATSYELSADGLFLLIGYDQQSGTGIQHPPDLSSTTSATGACYYSVEKILSSSLLSKSLKVRIYKTVILPVVLYGCETWTLTLREEQRLRMFENKVLRKIFGAKRDEVTGEWRKLHNAELHGLYTSPDIIRNIKSRRLRWAGHVARMGESRNAYRVTYAPVAGGELLQLVRLAPVGNALAFVFNNDLYYRTAGYSGAEERRLTFSGVPGVIYNGVPDWVYEVLYSCETWTLTLREEQRLRVFENKALRKIFGAKRDGVTGEWRKLHNAELHALYSSPDIIRNIKSRRLRWAGHTARRTNPEMLIE